MGKTRRKGDRGECATGEEGEQKLYLQSPLLECRIPEPDLIFLSDLPGGLDYNEWLASHTIGFFEHVNLSYGTVSEYCTQSSCQDMMGPGPRNYMWIDEKGKKCRLSAPQYVDYVMTYCQKTINDETVFPTKHGNEFPSGFEAQYIRKMVRLLFHVLAHIYHSHFKEIVLLQLHAHLNALFAHFVGFTVRFNLLEDKELEVLADLVVALKILPSNEGNGSNEGAAAGMASESSSASLSKSLLSSSNKPSSSSSSSQPMTSSAMSTTVMDQSMSSSNNGPVTSSEENKENAPVSSDDVITSEPQSSDVTTSAVLVTAALASGGGGGANDKMEGIEEGIDTNAAASAAATAATSSKPETEANCVEMTSDVDCSASEKD